MEETSQFVPNNYGIQNIYYGTVINVYYNEYRMCDSAYSTCRESTTVEDDVTTRFHRQDTVWVKKDDYPSFESVDCSAVFFHTLTGVRYTRNYIDSIVIKNPSVTYDPNTVHFYFYPKTDF